AEKLLTYALGRGLEYYDMPVVRSIAKQAANDDYRFQSLISAVVESEPFQMNMQGSESPEIQPEPGSTAAALIKE
ncbi:MAG TPA: DUF1585 domain-containing protein, partial [Gammaproteobacteria bacterium]|nr:DUF1585 domain-containing protein [Gammaproteobacteria bacterium]